MKHAKQSLSVARVGIEGFVLQQPPVVARYSQQISKSTPTANGIDDPSTVE
jgi:hypothetical protein